MEIKTWNQTWISLEITEHGVVTEEVLPWHRSPNMAVALYKWPIFGDCAGVRRYFDPLYIDPGVNIS